MRVPTPRRPIRSGLLAALALAAGPGLNGAPAAAQEAAQEREQHDDSARELRRILILRGGQVARGVTRLVDGSWELKQGGGWTAIDARAVERVVPEREALAEMRRREKALGDSAGERVAFAGWLSEQGLLEEALEALDRALAVSPHEPAALALLASRRWIAVPSLDVPAEELDAALDELLLFGAQAPRAGRELALLALAAHPDREALRERLERELGDDALRRRSFAAHALGRLYPAGDARRLLVHSVLDSSEEVRREASFALGAAEEPSLVVPLVRALGSENPRVRVQAAEALGNTGYAAAVAPLATRLANAVAQRSGAQRVPHAHVAFLTQQAYIQDFDVEVAQFQAVADPQVNVLMQGSVLDAGVLSTAHYAFAYETQVIRRSLGQLTGAAPGHTSRAWLDWWEREGARWRAAALDGAPETRTDG